VSCCRSGVRLADALQNLRYGDGPDQRRWLCVALVDVRRDGVDQGPHPRDGEATDLV
jgi:hypothetical protein